MLKYTELKLLTENYYMLLKYYKYIISVCLIMFIFVFCTITSVISANIESNEKPDKTPEKTTTTTTSSTTTTTTTADEKEPGNDEPLVIIPNNITICVDAGHGWGDVGTASLLTDENGKPLYYEKDINLQIAKLLRDELVNRGYTVIMMRESEDKESPAGNNPSDNICNADTRVTWVNKQDDIELMISIHCDSYPDSTDVNGTRIYYNHDRQPDMAILAPAIQQALVDNEAFTATPSVIKSKSVFASLRYCNKNSILVECGFITGDRDIQMLTDEAYQKKFAKSLAQGIDKYFDTVKS